MTPRRNGLTALVGKGAIAEEQLDAAIELAQIYPDAHAWRGFLDRLLLWSGSLALACSVLFFIAFNWTEMGRYARFGLVEGSLVLAIAIYWKMNGRGIVGQAALVAATLLLGVLLALFGQTYQTGADPWQLFFTWAILMLPWALLARAAVLWILWLVLLNLSIVLYYQTFGGVFTILLGPNLSAQWLLFLLNTSALAVWELCDQRWPWLAQSWAKRLLALGSSIAITLLALYAISDHKQGQTLALYVYPLWLAALYSVYRKRKPDLFMLANGCLSAITIVIYYVGNIAFDTFSAGSLLATALMILALSSAAAAWLKKVHRELSA